MHHASGHPYPFILFFFLFPLRVFHIEVTFAPMLPYKAHFPFLVCEIIFLGIARLGPWQHLRLLVDPGGGDALPAEDLLLLEPQGDLLLGVLDAVGTVADVAADVDGEVALSS